MQTKTTNPFLVLHTLTICCLLLLAANAWVPPPLLLPHDCRTQQLLAALAITRSTPSTTSILYRCMVENDNNDNHDDDDDEDSVEPGQMRVSEIKAELNLRQVTYSDCFDKDSLVERLREARATGRADPSILNTFNKQTLEEKFGERPKVDLSKTDIAAAVANDGTLPGGLTPETFQKLTSNPEIMTLLQSTKMQEAMSLMMTGGREELEQKIKDDPELQETVEKLDSIMKSL